MERLTVYGSYNATYILRNKCKIINQNQNEKEKQDGDDIPVMSDRAADLTADSRQSRDSGRQAYRYYIVVHQ